MNRQQDEFEYTLEEIIAEVKGEKKAEPASPLTHVAARDEAAEDGGGAIAVKKGEKAAERPKEAEEKPAKPQEKPEEDATGQEGTPKPGRHEKEEKKEPSIAVKIYEEEQRRYEEEQRQERRRQRLEQGLEDDEPLKAPWHTRRRFFRDEESDTKEFDEKEAGQEDTAELEERYPAGDEEEEEDDWRPPKRKLEYDFINHAFEDASDAVSELSKKAVGLTARMAFIFPLLLVSIYITGVVCVGFPVPFGFTYDKYSQIYLIVLCAIEVFAMLLASDVMKAGVWRLFKGRPTLDTVTFFSCICTLVHGLSVIFNPSMSEYFPYNCVSVATCLFAVAAKRQRAQTLKRTYKASLLGTAPTGVRAIKKGKEYIAVKTEENSYVEMEDFCQLDTAEKASEIYAPIIIAASVGFAIVSSYGGGNGGNFLWCLGAIASVTAPFGLLTAASMPAKRVTKKLFSSGSALINFTKSKRLSRVQSVVLRDGDLFPAGSVSIIGMKIAKNQKMETVVACAAAMLENIDGGVSKAFFDFARQQYTPLYKARDIRFFESGGMTANVEGRSVAMGSLSFLMRMGIRVTEGSRVKNGLFIAINSVFAGVFALKYGVQPQAYNAFHMLRQIKVEPILATRDINIHQGYVESQFELRPDTTVYPDLNVRIALSEPAYGSDEEPLAIMSRDGMMPFAEILMGAKKLRLAVRTSLVFGFISSGFGIMLMYFLTSGVNIESATPLNVLMYLLLWTLPSWLISMLVTKM